MDDVTKYLLEENKIPKTWYNISADLPKPLAPPLHPGTHKPIGPDDLAPLFPMALIGQEVSQEREIEIPEPVREIYKQWRPSPLFRAKKLEKNLDTPAKIVLNPATEYVRKFTEEVPREKVLKIEAVMDPVSDNQNLSDLKVSKDAIIETVAEKILSQEKSVAVIDSNNKVVGIVKPSKVIHTVFGGRKENS